MRKSHACPVRHRWECRYLTPPAYARYLRPHGGRAGHRLRGCAARPEAWPSSDPVGHADAAGCRSAWSIYGNGFGSLASRFAHRTRNNACDTQVIGRSSNFAIARRSSRFASLTTFHSLLMNMVGRWVTLNAGHCGMPEWLGLPVRANATHAPLTLSASGWIS